MSNKSRKNKSSQSTKQEPERASEKAMRESVPDISPSFRGKTPKEKNTELKSYQKEAITNLPSTITHKPGIGKTTAPPDKQGPTKEKQSAGFTFESTARVTGLRIHKAAIELECIARELNTETIFGITAVRFQSFADKIKKYPGQLEKKAAKERRLLTQTETKEEKNEKKAKVLRERIQAMQTKLAAL